MKQSVVTRIKTKFGIMTAHLRTEPSFMVIGVMKGGTTSLCYALFQNPKIGKARKKELHYFTHHYARKEAWYRAQFPMKWFSKNILFVDASPDYIAHPEAPRRIYDAYPNMKFIVLLRNPVDRAYSHYQWNMKKKFETRTFQEVVDEALKLEKHDDRQPFDNQREYHYAMNCLARGRYVEQLQRWYKYFSREQFLILQSEYFYKHSKESIAEVCRFLGIANAVEAINENRNPGNYSEKINPVIRQSLVEYFRPYNEQLYQLLGKDFGWE